MRDLRLGLVLEARRSSKATAARRSWLRTLRSALLRGTFLVLAGALPTLAADANRFAHIDSADPFWVDRDAPRLTTPQWFGEDDVDAVVILAIDDMRDPARYETYLRPILDRLREIEGRAPLSIMTNRVDPAHPLLEKFLAEGVSIECHTLDHPCPILAQGDFGAGKATYDGCVDLLAKIPGNLPVAFRVPCMDSINSPSPRFFAEIFAKTTKAGRFLTIDSSVVNLVTANDPELPRTLVFAEDGAERFRRYLPFPSFVNVVEDYPYPWVIGKLAWELPCVVPSDWEAQNLRGVNHPETVSDLKAALDVVVRKRGTFTLVFHPHGWIRNDQIVELIDHAASRYGRRVRFLSFRDADERLSRALFRGERLRAADGYDNGVRVLDLDGDGFQDVVIANERRLVMRLWDPRRGEWREAEFPVAIVDAEAPPGRRDTGVRFGVIDGQAVILRRAEGEAGAWRLEGARFTRDDALLDGLVIDGAPIETAKDGIDLGVRLRDLDGDGGCELVAGGRGRGAIFRWESSERRWRRLPFDLPAEVAIVDAEGRDAGFRLIDADEDGKLDVLFSNAERYGLYLFDSLERGFARVAVEGERGSPSANELPDIPPIVRADGTQNGFWLRRGTLWFQNEDTAQLPDLVDRRPLASLLAKVETRPRTADAAGRSFHVRPGFRVELAAAEPLIRDPIAFDWDEEGRLWVVEMHDYPTGVGGSLEERGEPGGRVVVLTDDDGDYRYDRSSVFLDGLSFPTTAKPWGKGAIVIAVPEIFYAEDTDGDGKADRRETLYRGFQHGNEQHLANGLAWGLDGWLYAANGDSGGSIESARTGKRIDIRGRDLRVHPDSGEIDAVTGLTQFGRARNDAGDWFGCSNPNPCFHFVFPDRYLTRNPQASYGSLVRQVAPPAGEVFPRSPIAPRVNDLHMAGRFTSACGLTIYRDDLFGPEFRGNAFVSEPVHNLVHRIVIEEDGTTFTSRRANGEERSEFLSSSDPWFRPTSLRAGPDGALWIADMVRQVIEHPEYFFTGDYRSLDIRAGDDLGRIWRVVPIGRDPRRFPGLRPDRERSRVRHLRSPNGWTRDKAQELIVRSGSPDDVQPLRALARDANAPAAARLHALAALAGLDRAGVEGLDDDVIARALDDSDPSVRRFAIELCENRLPPPDILAAALLARVEESSPRVALQLALTLGDWSDARAGEALGDLALRWHEDPGMLDALKSSARHHAETIVRTILGAKDANRIDTGGRDRLLTRFVPDLVRRAKDRPDALASTIDELGRRCEKGEGGHEALAALLRALRRDRELRSILSGDLETRLVAVGRSARAQALGDASDEMRVQAIGLVAEIAASHRDDHERAAELEALASLLDPRESFAVRRATVSALERSGATADAASILLDAWRSSTPPIRAAILDATIARGDSAALLLDRIEAGTILPREIDPARRRRLLEHARADLRERARALIAAGDASESERAKTIERLLPAASAGGDASRGIAVFEERCATCHRLAGRGHAVGPDLETVSGRSPEALLVDLVDPNRAVEDRFTAYAVVTNDGRALSGIVVEETSVALTLLGQDGRREVVPRVEIAVLESSGASLMPEGLEAELSPEDVASLIAAIRARRAPPKEFPGNEPGIVRAGANGDLDLRASRAEIRGPSLVFEPRFGNLGFWGSPEDFALWRIEAPRAGVYEVSLLFACPENEAGDEIAVETGGGRVVGTIGATASWDDYREASIGRIELGEGAQEVIVRSSGPIRGYLVDLQAVRLNPVE